jgi:hypothetical protein
MDSTVVETSMHTETVGDREVELNAEYPSKTNEEVEMPDIVIHNDSGHESSGSVSGSPELPSTPEGESQSIIGNSDQKEGKVDGSHELSDGKFYRIKIHIPGGENIDVQVLR